MYEKFTFDRIALSLIDLDHRNPRLVTQQKLTTTDEILQYFFEHEALAQFTKMIATREGIREQSVRTLSKMVNASQ